MTHPHRFEDAKAELIARTTADYAAGHFGGHLPASSRSLFCELLYDICLVSIRAYVQLPPVPNGLPTTTYTETAK